VFSVLSYLLTCCASTEEGWGEACAAAAAAARDAREDVELTRLWSSRRKLRGS